MMLGIADPWVWLAYVLSIFSALLCLGWGCWRWNYEVPETTDDAAVRRWADAEDKIEEEL